MGQSRPHFHLFSSFQTNITIFTINYVNKCPSSIRCWDLSPRPSGHEFPPITTRPGLPPQVQNYFVDLHRHCHQGIANLYEPVKVTKVHVLITKINLVDWFCTLCNLGAAATRANTSPLTKELHGYLVMVESNVKSKKKFFNSFRMFRSLIGKDLKAQS